MRTQFKTSIAIAPADAARADAPAWRPDAVVAIASPVYRRPVAGGVVSRPWHQLGLLFHDIETAAHGHRRGPALAHIEAFADFLTEHAPRRLLIHCRAGLSRSPAFAVVAMLAGGHPDPLGALALAAPGSQPNRRVLALAERRYGVQLVERTGEIFPCRRTRWGAVGPGPAEIVEVVAAGPTGGSKAMRDGLARDFSSKAAGLRG